MRGKIGSEPVVVEQNATTGPQKSRPSLDGG
jgi:hypothetical protein